MGTNRRAAGILSLAAMFMSFTPNPARGAAPGVIAQKAVAGTSKVPFKIYRDFLVVAEGQMGGSPHNFILDTGTAPSIINEKSVKQLGLKMIPSSFTAAGQFVLTQSTTIPEIDLGPIRLTSVPVQVQDLSRLERDLGIEIGGVVGLDVLSKSSFRLDYDKKVIEFGRSDPVGIPVPFDEHTGLAIALVEIEGKPVHLLIDSGTDRLILLGGNFPEVKWLALSETSQTGSSVAAQSMRVQVFSAPNVTLGGQDFRISTAYLVPASSDPVFDGLLGPRALGFHSLSYDQSRQTIYLQ